MWEGGEGEGCSWVWEGGEVWKCSNDCSPSNRTDCTPANLHTSLILHEASIVKLKCG